MSTILPDDTFETAKTADNAWFSLDETLRKIISDLTKVRNRLSSSGACGNAIKAEIALFKQQHDSLIFMHEILTRVGKGIAAQERISRIEEFGGWN